MSDIFTPRPIDSTNTDPTPLINNLTLRFTLHALAERHPAFDSGAPGYYNYWAPLRAILFYIRYHLQSDKVLAVEDRVWLLAGLETMTDELDFYTQLVLGDIQTEDATPENVMEMRAAELVRWRQMLVIMKERIEGSGGRVSLRLG